MTDKHVKESTLDLSFYRDWAAKREKALEKDKGKTVYFVTVSREFCCEGYDFSTALIERINKRSSTEWSLFTRRMIDEMISSDNIPVEMVQQVSEKRWRFSDWFIDALVPDYLQSQSTHVYKNMRNLILNLAHKGNCVILGSAGQILLQALDPDKFHGVHVRLTAPYEWRVRHVERMYGMNRDEAEHTLRARQSARDRFISDFTGRNSSDPALYDIIFNNARNTPAHMADVIVEDLALRGAFKE